MVFCNRFHRAARLKSSAKFYATSQWWGSQVPTRKPLRLRLQILEIKLQQRSRSKTTFHCNNPNIAAVQNELMLTQVIHPSWGIESLWIRDADLSSTDTYRLRGRSISIREEFLTPLLFCISLQRTAKRRLRRRWEQHHSGPLPVAAQLIPNPMVGWDPI